MEADILPVFRRFLHSKSVILDIGANFGLYTAISASLMRRHGRLYSFEANPHTFELLKRTLYANRLAHNPNVVAVNALIGENTGRGTLHYLPQFLGGATMTDIGQWGEAKRSIELDMITIDEFLPGGLMVDLVKIDVEGHEPFVIRGMKRRYAVLPTSGSSSSSSKPFWRIPSMPTSSPRKSTVWVCESAAYCRARGSSC